jgi:TetR/AcrR family transcriptional repressor of mexJK operon
MTTSPPASKRRASAKRDDVLRAATAAFLEVGYGRASMDQIAAKAAVSKATVYSHFGSKEALFEAIIRDLVQGLVQPLAMAPTGDSPETTLTAFARGYVALLLAPSSLALHRLLVAEATRNPDLAVASYRAGGEPAVSELAEYLAQESAKGTIAVEDPKLAAEQLFGMLTGHWQVRALLRVEEAPPRAALEHYIADAVGAFLRAHAPSATARGGSGS